MALSNHQQEYDEHSQGVGGSLDNRAVTILARGIIAILQMTENLAFQALRSEKVPLLYVLGYRFHIK